MNTSFETLNEPLPTWLDEIKDEARRKITGAHFGPACRAGDRAVMRGLILGIWPFVNEFPRTLIRGMARLRKNGSVGERQLLNTFLHRGSNVLSGIRKDEENHRKLWLDTAEALGLRYPLDYESAVIAETQAWIDLVNADAEPATLLLRFAAVEIVAETVSADLLASKTFTAILGEKGCEWFRVHAEHGPGMTHEELELRLAFSFLYAEPDRERTNAVIQGVVDLGVAALEASAMHGQLHAKESRIS